MSNPTEGALAAEKEPGPREHVIKPEGYRHCCIVVQNTPYQIENREHNGMPPEGGVLPMGTVVWVKQRHAQGADLRVLGYAEGIGIISVEPRYLRPSC